MLFLQDFLIVFFFCTLTFNLEVILVTNDVSKVLLFHIFQFKFFTVLVLFRLGQYKLTNSNVPFQMKPLEIYLIEMIADDRASEFEEEKVSSSSQRMRLLGTG